MSILLLSSSEIEEAEEESIEDFVEPIFKQEIFKFLHKPIRDADKKTTLVERFLQGPQSVWDDTLTPKREALIELTDPTKCPTEALQYLKPIVGFTSELNNITDNLSENDLRKLILLAIPLWKQKGLEVGYSNILRLLIGVTSRIHNWFKFRKLIGVAALGDELLEDDEWFISLVGISSKVQTNNIVGLWSFENNVKDTSINKNNGELVGEFSFSPFTALSASNYSINLDGGFFRITNSSVYDFSGDITIEMFVATNKTEDNILIAKAESGGKGVVIRYDSVTNDVTWTIDDGTNTATDTYATGLNLDDLTFRHIALTIDKTKGFGRIWVAGNGGAKIDISTVSDLTTLVDILTADDTFADVFKGYIDNLRISTDAIYDVDSATITIPTTTFIEHQDEQLDEFRTDIRIVDDGSIDRVLLKRILNLMRPISERLNIIYITFFTDFTEGKINFDTLAGGSSVVDNQLKLTPNTLEQYNGVSSDFEKILLQLKLKITVAGTIDIRFSIQDSNNYYLLRIITSTKLFQVFKVVATVESSISSTNFQNIFLDVFYFITIVSFYDSLSGNTKIKCYLDRNLMIDVTDTTFNNGGFAIETDNTSEVTIDEIELFKHPLTIETIAPGFSD